LPTLNEERDQKDGKGPKGRKGADLLRVTGKGAVSVGVAGWKARHPFLGVRTTNGQTPCEGPGGRVGIRIRWPDPDLRMRASPRGTERTARG